MPRGLLPLFLMLAFGLAGCTQGNPGPWHGRNLDQQDPSWDNATLEPGWSLRLDVAGKAQSDMEWDWFVAERQELDFDVYRHEPDRLMQLVDITATEDRDSVFGTWSAMYTFIWTNPTQERLDL